jgi:hypothetical protein
MLLHSLRRGFVFESSIVFIFERLRWLDERRINVVVDIGGRCLNMGSVVFLNLWCHVVRCDIPTYAKSVDRCMSIGLLMMIELSIDVCIKFLYFVLRFCQVLSRMRPLCCWLYVIH